MVFLKGGGGVQAPVSPCLQLYFSYISQKLDEIIKGKYFQKLEEITSSPSMTPVREIDSANPG